ncbi:MAG: hypothetical protein KBT57_11960 [bacterium]|nr:hypothetical protein [Candidatus Limimorpha equi]
MQKKGVSLLHVHQGSPGMEPLYLTRILTPKREHFYPYEIQGQFQVELPQIVSVCSIPNKFPGLFG